MESQKWIVNGPEAMRFQVNRVTMVDPQVLELERRRIFDVCWIYVGHESEVRNPGDLRRRIVCDRPVLFGGAGRRHRRPATVCRHSAKRWCVFPTACGHRGSSVCRETEGSARSHTCFYHGWSY